MFPKVTSEYTKTCDPYLPFYYYTGSNNRYNNGLLALFNVPSSTGEERLDHVRMSRKADPGIFVVNRAVVDNLHDRLTSNLGKKTGKKLPFSQQFQLKNSNFFCT